MEPILTLAQVYGSAGAAKVASIEKAGQIVFHSVGDTGSVVGPATQSLVADKMGSDFDEDESGGRAFVSFSPGRRRLLLWRGDLLLRSVLRTLS